MGFPLINPFLQFVDATGAPLAGAKLFSYVPSSSTKKTTWLDAGLSTPNSNPIILDDAGRCSVYLTDGELYKFVLAPAADSDPPSSPIETADDVRSPYALTQAQIGAALYPRTDAEIAAGVTPTNYAYEPDPVIDPRRYGADPGGTLDSTLALRNACLVLQAAGGSAVEFGSGTYKVYTDTGDTDPIGEFSSITGLELRASGAKFVVNRAFSTAVVIPVFTFTACHNINIGDFVGTNPAGARSEIYNRGAQMFYFYQGCTNIRGGNLDLTDWSTGYNFYRLSTDPQSYRSRNIRIANIKALRTGYPLVTTASGDELDAHINTESCGRSYFNFSSRNHKIVVVSKNQDASANCLLYASEGEILTDIDLEYSDKESTNGVPGTRKGVQLAFRDETPNIIRNIKIKLDVDKAGGYLTNALSVDKLTLAGPADTVDRGHIFENFEVTGYADTDASPVALGDYVTWGAGETVSNIKIANLSLKTAQSSFYFFSSLKDQAIFENVTSEAALNIVGNTSGRITCIGVKAPDVTLSSADTSYVDYIGCNITSGSTQSYLGKTFQNTFINGSLAMQGSATFNPASLADGDGETTTVTVTGAALGDFAVVSFSLALQGITVTAWVSAANTVSVRFQNESGGVLDVGSGTLRARVFKV